MAYGQEEQRENSHDILLKDRERMSISGVVEVKAFDENNVMLHTTQGTLTVRGEGLHVERIDLERGHLAVQGLVRELRYDELPESHGFWARLFG